jgi:putative ABC transport system permease protein
MTAAALRVARADLTGRRGQTLLTALAVFAAAAALFVTLTLRSGIDDPFAAAKAATHGSDLTITGNLSSAQLRDVARMPGVAQAQTRPFVPAVTPLGGESVTVALEAQSATLDRPHVTDGRLPRAGEVLLERSFARASDLRPGGRLTLRHGGRTITLPIAGLAVTTEQATYPGWTPGVAWAPAATVRRLGGVHTALALRLIDPNATDPLKARLEEAYPGRRVDVTDWHDVRDTITDQTRTNTIIIGVNTLLALIAVGFTVATVISGRVLAQRREIGLLKAVGLTPRGVVALLVGEYLAIGLAAGLLGLVAGVAFAPLLLHPMAALLATPTPSALQPGTLALTLVLVLAAVALFTFVPALRAGRLNTVDALALGRAPASGGASRAARAAAALRLPLVARLGVKDALASRLRAGLTIAALGLMVVTLVAALSVEATYDKVIGDPALRAKPWDLRVEPDALGTARALSLVRGERGVARATTLADFSATLPGGGGATARAVGPGFQRFPYAVPDGRMFARAGEAVAGRGFYDTHHLRIGDTVTLHVAGAALRLHLVGRHVEPDGNGNVVIFSRSTLPAAAAARIGGGDVIASFVAHADGRAIQRDLERRSGSRIAGELVSDDVRQERADVRPIVYGSSALLVVVALVNLLTTLLLVARERVRDFGILKAVGLTPRGALGVVNAGAAVLGLVAIVFGIPAGILIFRTLIALTSPSEGTDIVGTPGPLALALLIPAVLVVTALASSLPARRAAAVSAAEVLRAE